MSFGSRSPYSSSHYESSYGRPAACFASTTRAYRPRFDTGSHRPRHDTSLWRENSYRPLYVRTHSNNGRDTVKDVTVDLNIRANTKAHHTDQYDMSDLILRRGQDFQLTITLERTFDTKKDKLRLQFVTGKEPKQTKKTLLKVPVVEHLDPTEWGAVIESTRATPGGGVELGVRVMSASDAVVGLYSLYVEIRLSEDENDNTNDKMQRYKHPSDIYIIFNAWCQDDAVYMASEADRQEYVLNETGRIYIGSARSICGRPWNFGQFEKVCFKAAIYLLEKCSLRTEALGNPTLVTRALTAMANSNDNDGGVLTGNWTGQYSGGRAPCTWNGSVKILEEYMISHREVKFGQCWVFSGLLTTLSRTLGLPARSVTNFDSAHDSDHSMTIDNHVNWDGKPLTHMDDSIWNFHVWNEAWFKRHDLPPGNDGWQAFDATPQECSEGRMRCGPASVNSVRDGNIYLPHDTKFIFAEVNGDRIIWMMKPDGDLVAVDCQPKCVGSFISTKAVGSNERADITANYKHPEGSAEERQVVKKVSQHSSRCKALETFYKIKKSHDVSFSCESTTAKNGDVTIVLTAKNASSEPRHVTVVMCATARYYTGVPGEELGERTMDLVLEPGEQKEAEWFYEAVSFICQLDEDAAIGIYVTALIKETEQVFTTQKVIDFDKPDLELEVSSNRVKVAEQFDLVVRFTNHFDFTLKTCVLNVEGPGIQDDLNIPLHRSIKPGEMMSQKVRLTPKFRGKREIIANFHSERLVGITGSVVVDVV